MHPLIIEAILTFWGVASRVKGGSISQIPASGENPKNAKERARRVNNSHDMITLYLAVDNNGMPGPCPPACVRARQTYAPIARGKKRHPALAFSPRAAGTRRKTTPLLHATITSISPIYVPQMDVNNATPSEETTGSDFTQEGRPNFATTGSVGVNVTLAADTFQEQQVQILDDFNHAIPKICGHSATKAEYNLDVDEAWRCNLQSGAVEIQV